MEDKGKIVEVAEIEGGLSLTINGVVRTEIAVADADFGAAEPPYHICEVNHPTVTGVGSMVAIGSPTSCQQNSHSNLQAGYQYWQSVTVGPIMLPNPAISFTAVPDGAMVLSEADATLVSGRDPDTKVLQSLNVDCPLAHVGPEDYTFMRYGDEYYRHEDEPKRVPDAPPDPVPERLAPTIDAERC